MEISALDEHVDVVLVLAVSGHRAHVDLGQVEGHQNVSFGGAEDSTLDYPTPPLAEHGHPRFSHRPPAGCLVGKVVGMYAAVVM